MPKRNPKQTSSRAAKAASKVLRDGRTSKASKTAAASALAQAKGEKVKLGHRKSARVLKPRRVVPPQAPRVAPVQGPY
ncbi:hypothetical protein PCS70012_02312 [Streptococcus pneumoniae PCS70012]|nr:hypothetical protein PCS70012_02312 [Streptococcus pneumoniae PCS70012]